MALPVGNCPHCHCLAPFTWLKSLYNIIPVEDEKKTKMLTSRKLIWMLPKSRVKVFFRMDDHWYSFFCNFRAAKTSKLPWAWLLSFHLFCHISVFVVPLFLLGGKGRKFVSIECDLLFPCHTEYFS